VELKYDGEAWFALAAVLLQEKDFDAAEKAFQDAVKYKTSVLPTRTTISVLVTRSNYFAD
jgi:cytochrome c-type biogenesis protein CcmH/NrfG